MRNLLLILLLAFLAACSQPRVNSTIRLNGTVENPSNEPIEFVFYRDFTNNHREIISLELNENNQFSAEFELPGPAAGTLRNGRSSIQLFLKQGDQLELNADANDWMASLRCTGTAGEVNQFIVNYQRDLLPGIGNSFVGNAAASLSPDAFKAILDSIAGVKAAFLAGYPGGDNFDPAFRKFFETEVRYDQYQRLISYPAMYQRSNQLEQAPDMPENYYDFLHQDNLFDDSRLNSETYVNFLLAYLGHCAQDPAFSFMEDSSEHEITYFLARDHIPSTSGEYVQAISINREFNYGDLDKAKALYDDFMASAASEDLKQRVTITWEGIQALMPGNPAPDFTMTDINGNEVSLSDFRGKVVYLKFWASWCGPCMRQVPPAKELKERLSGQEDLVFIYVSIDTDTAAWRNTIARNEITGVHFNTPGRERGVPTLFQVKWIPAFFIIGKDGNIFDNRPPQPADPGVEEALLKALTE